MEFSYMCCKFMIENLSSEYSVRKFTEIDITDIYNLAKTNPTYYKYMKTEPTYENLKDVFNALPPNKTMSDKFFLGFYNHEERLVAILDLILNYPNNQTAFIGWFMMNKNFQHKGIGTKIITDICYYLKKSDFLFIRLGYIKGNNESKCFWNKNKFTFTGIETQDVNYSIVVMERKL